MSLLRELERRREMATLRMIEDTKSVLCDRECQESLKYMLASDGERTEPIACCLL